MNWPWAWVLWVDHHANIIKHPDTLLSIYLLFGTPFNNDFGISNVPRYNLTGIVIESVLHFPSHMQVGHFGGPMRKPGNRPEHLELPAEPLLNEEQRAALDAALAKKRLEQGGFIFDAIKTHRLVRSCLYLHLLCSSGAEIL